MTLDQAIDGARKGHEIQGVFFAAPLILYLDSPSSERRVFEWLIPCIGDILDQLGANTPELRESLILAERSLIESHDSKAIEAKAWDLWHNRGQGDAKTAVAQLLFALLGYRKQQKNVFISCAAPLSILDRMASDQGGALERILSNFSEYVSR